MEVSWQLQRPVSGSRSVFHERGLFKIKPFVGSFSNVRTTQSLRLIPWCSEHPRSGISSHRRIFASSDFSRKRQRKISTPRPRESAGKKFAPKTPVGMNTPKRDQKKNGMREGSSVPTLSEYGGPSEKTPEAKVGIEEKLIGDVDDKILEEHVDEAEKEDEEIQQISKSLAVAESSQLMENGSVGRVDENVAILEKKETSGTNVENVIDETVLETNIVDNDVAVLEKKETSGTDVENVKDEIVLETNIVDDDVEASKTDVKNLKDESVLETNIVDDDVAVFEKKETSGTDIENVKDETVLETNIVDDDVEASGTDVKNVKDESVLETNIIDDVVAVLEKKETSGTEVKNVKDESVLETNIVDDDVEASGTDVKNVKDESVLETNDVVAVLEKKETPGTEVKNVKDESVLETNIVDDDIAKLQKREIISKTNIKNLKDESFLEGKELALEKSSDIVNDEGVKKDVKAFGDASLKLKSEIEARLKLEMEAKLKLEMEAKLKLEMEAKLRKQEIERLADVSFLKENKMFVYPQVVKPDEDIELFLNRSLSTLNDESDVLVMGAFNDWRWKSFTVRLNKTDLKGDWWSCQLHVPKEAYKIDFVFFNGQDVYDNNDKKDFCITVEGGMDVFAFEDFLLEEKRREQEKLAKECRKSYD